MTSAILQRSEAKPMRVATWGFADSMTEVQMRVATWGYAGSANQSADAHCHLEFCSRADCFVKHEAESA